MRSQTEWRAAYMTDAGRVRDNNEDAVYVDDALGIFLVVDGLGGHAAGEKAAEVAIQAIRERFEADEGDTEEQIREAIAGANNRVLETAQRNPTWRGMMCVLTLAVVDGRHVTIGHVGDTRLYRVRQGTIKKMTPDHSPIGEREDRGELTERQAMEHPRRNEVFRDVGSEPRQPFDEEFIDIIETSLPPDAAILLCSDGLSDLLASDEILKIVSDYRGDPNETARALVNAANEAGGRDNITVIFIAGSRFPEVSRVPLPPRKVITRRLGPAGPQPEEQPALAANHAPLSSRAPRRILPAALFLITGLLVGGAAVWGTLRLPIRRPQPIPKRILEVGPNLAYRGIQEALATAAPGDTIQVAAGEYAGPIRLKEGVRLVSDPPAGASIRLLAIEAESAVSAAHIRQGSLEGFRIAADLGHPFRYGIHLLDADLDVIGVEVESFLTGIAIEGNCHPRLIGNYLHGQKGAAITLRGGAAPLLIRNLISENGWKSHPAHAALEIFETSRPSAVDTNIFAGNAEDISGWTGQEWIDEVRLANLFIPAKPERRSRKDGSQH